MSFSSPWAGAFGLQTFVRCVPDALPEACVQAIHAAIMGSRWVADNQLNEPFQGTYGFSLTFRRDALGEVLTMFPAFEPYLAATLLPGCDAFVLNPLLIADGRGVGPHTDQSLSPYDAAIGCPAAVSVFYVQVPAGLVGGELRLSQFGQPVATVVPTPRTLVTFRGDLSHRVTPVEGGAPGIASARISLVVEQYQLPPAAGKHVPRLVITSRAGLEARV